MLSLDKLLFCGFFFLAIPACQSEIPKLTSEELFWLANSTDQKRKQKDDYFRSSMSPLPPDKRNGFDGLKYYPYDHELAFRVRIDFNTAQQLTTLLTSDGSDREYTLVGTISFEVNGNAGRLAVFQSTSSTELFVPFSDATADSTTYRGGRYLELIKDSDVFVILDFNSAYNPWCVYSENYSCPLPPVSNRLEFPVRAGEKLLIKP